MGSDAGYGVVPIEQARAMDGLSLFTGLLEGRFPAPPITKALGFRVSEVERGPRRLRLHAGLRPLQSAGHRARRHRRHLARLVMGCCIHTTLKAGIGYTTVEIKVNYVRAMTDKTGPVKAEGKVINVGSRIGTSEGKLYDSAGKLLAHGTTTCLIFPI